MHAAVIHLVHEETLQRLVFAEEAVEEESVGLGASGSKLLTTGRSSELWT